VISRTLKEGGEGVPDGTLKRPGERNAVDTGVSGGAAAGW